MNSTLFTNLTTERLYLRELNPDDAEEIFRLRSEEKVNEFVDRPRAVTMDDAVEFIQKILAMAANKEVVMWAITFTGDTKLVGTIVYWNIETEKKKAEIGYELLPEYQGKGIMTEALKKVIGFGFEQLKFKTITADPKAGNRRSVKLLEKLGFVKTGKTPDALLIFELSNS